MKQFRFYNCDQIEGRGCTSLEEWRKRCDNYTVIQWNTANDIFAAIPDITYIDDDVLHSLSDNVFVSYHAHDYLIGLKSRTLIAAKTFEELFEKWEWLKSEID